MRALYVWDSYGVEYYFESRLAMMLCGYWNRAYGDYFSGNINRQIKGAFHGPPKLATERVKQTFELNSPKKIAREFVELVANYQALKSYNHRNAWSESEMMDL